MSERIVSPEELAQRLGIPLPRLYEWVLDPRAARVRLPVPRRVGPRSIGWLSTEIDELIRELPRLRRVPRELVERR